MLSWALLLGGLAGLGIGGGFMALRLSHRHIPLVWFEKPIEAQEFVFLSEPVMVSVDEGESGIGGAGDGGARGRALLVEFRGRRIEFPIEPGMLDDPRLPGLKRFDDWLRVVPMVTGARTQEEVRKGLADGSLNPRLLVAVRMPAEGYDPESWGLVRRKDWRYRFALLDARAPMEEAVTESEGVYSDLDLLGDPGYRRAKGREEEVWKFHAMLQVTPATAYRSKNRPLAEAMGVMGWTWTLSGLSIMAIMGGAAGLGMRGRGE